MALHLVLVEPEIPWNTGNIGRTALALGADLHLVEPLGFSLDEKDLRRSGLDYWSRVRVHRWPTWSRFEEALPTLGEPYLFTASGERSYWNIRYAQPAVLVFGRESVGLSKDLLARFPERTVRITRPIVPRTL